MTDSFFISNSKSCLLVFFLVNECGAKLDMNDLNDKSKMCSYFQDAMACYPACYCNNAAMKSALDKSIKSSEDTLKALGVTCSLTCGNGEAASHGPFVSYGSKAGAGNYQQAISKMQGPNADPNVRDTRESVLLY